MIRSLVVLIALPATLFAGELTIEEAMVPLAPPGVMAHAAYFTMSNAGDAPRQLIGVSAEGYMMAQIHRSEEKDGVVTMSSVDLIEIAPGQSVSFEPGGLHVMLMRPETPLEKDGQVELILEFANGETRPVSAAVMPMASMHAHGS